jgi:hypothetical protein
LTIPSFGAKDGNNKSEFEGQKIEFKILPDISDQKTASYTTDLIMGRTSPMKNYVASDERTLGIIFHFITTGPNDTAANIRIVRLIQAMVYPRNADVQMGVPYIPPPVCRFQCGKLLSKDALCVVLKNYSLKLPTDVAWDENYLCPVKFDLDTSWDVVFASSELPGANNIISF